MDTHILKEEDWETFIQTHIIPRFVQTKHACILALVGDLGAGKTTFSKVFLKQFGVKKHVQSPTFSIINSYDLTESPIRSGMTEFEFEKIFHCDMYRVGNLQELDTLHFNNVLDSPKNIVLIEWADKIKKYLPKDALWIYFEHDTLETRKVVLDSRLRGNDGTEIAEK